MRKFLKLVLAVVLLAASSLAAFGATEDRTIRFAMTPAFLHDQHALLADWRAYMEARLKRPVEFVRRNRYRETMDLLQQQKVEFAWICDYPYVMLKADVRLMAVGLNKGKPTYRSYLIVPARDTRTRGFDDLKGGVFAYADPYSNTGYLVPRFRIKGTGADPDKFFRRSFFTWSHRKVIDAVAAGLAQGGSVDSYVWDALKKLDPDVTDRTRIVWKSAQYGFPPMVAHRSVPEADFAAMQALLLNMQNDAEGRALLERFKLDGFIPGTPKLYDSVAAMIRAFGEP